MVSFPRWGVLFRWTLLLALCSQVVRVQAHSWIACTKYLGADADLVYDDNKCDGYPRNWEEYNGGGFARDRGYNYAGVGCGPQYQRTYSSRYYRATYRTGERVCLAWPSKNHVAAVTKPDGSTCARPTNVFIPDNGIRLSILPYNPDRDPTQGEFDANRVQPFGNGVHVNGVQDYKGFQNCPGFCDNNDGSLCTGCFTVPSLPQGNYTLQWWWQFNLGEIYTSCFDAIILSETNTRTSSETSAPTIATQSSAPASSSTVQTSSTAPSTSTAATSTTQPQPTGTSAPTQCQYDWQCQGVSENYNFVSCNGGRCRCNSGFAGEATSESKCRCDATLEWLNGVAYCVPFGQCVYDRNCPPRVCTSQGTGVGFCT